jgi:site-specific DNA recombinase
MPPPHGAIYARVSSEQHADTPPMARQVAAWRDRVAIDGWAVAEARQCLDAGYRGATLVRPALERLRDVGAAGSVDRLSGHAPDRLARTYADPVLRVAACRRAGVAGIFLTRALGQSPEDDLRLQGQGRIAEDERAKSIEGHRRGKRHAARVGAGHVRSGAPSGDRSVPTDEGGGQARYESIPDAARVVRPVFPGVGHDRLTRGAGCRRLTRAGEVTRPGKTVWDRRVVGGILKQPASQGAAAFGKTRQEPRRPRRRAQRHRPRQPRRAVSMRAVPPEDWSTIPVPARVEPAVCAAGQEQWREHQRPARHSRRGALSLRPGGLQGHHGGDAFYGQRRSPSARKGQPRA